MKIIILMFFEDKNLVNCQFLGLEWAWGILDDPLLYLRNVQVRLSYGFGLFDNRCVFKPTILFYLSVPLPLWQKSELRHYTKGAPLCVPIYLNCSHENWVFFHVILYHVNFFFNVCASCVILAAPFILWNLFLHFLLSTKVHWFMTKSHMEKFSIV